MGRSLRENPDSAGYYKAVASRCGQRRKGATISASLSPTDAPDSEPSGSFPGSGTYFCVECGSHLALRDNDRLPECPQCGASEFRLDSIFESRQEHAGGSTDEFLIPQAAPRPRWHERVREMLPESGRYLAYLTDDSEVEVIPLRRGWSRIGRSAVADIRLDDPSVSRRHALVVFDDDETLHVLDDRSLNGVFVNDELVEWGSLEDGDELIVGRFRLLVLEA
jgi:hypothetical protein